MRFSPTKLLHGMLYTAPVLLLTLAACGGGGSGGSSTPLASAYTLSVNVTGVSGVGVVLRNNGGDDLTVTTPGVYPFGTQVISGTGYNVTVLTHPSAPVQVCTVTSPSGTMPASALTVNVSCVNAYTIGGTITSVSSAGIGPILQNNLGDNLFINAITTSSASFTFNTPVANGGAYSVTQLSRARAPTQNCVVTGGDDSNGGGTVASANVSSVVVTCTATTAIPKFAYVTNNTADTVSAYTINATSGTLALVEDEASGDGPYSVTVDPSGQFAYVANSNADTVSAYSIVSGTGALTALSSIATGDFPISITVHPSGKFAYVVNQGNAVTTGNTISAYSINTSTGALSAMDADGATTGTQATIATGTLPYAVVVDPTGQFAYVANDTSNNVSVYTINQTTGALTAGTAVSAGTNPRSIAIAPAGTHAFVANGGSNNVSTYSINATTGALTLVNTYIAGSAPRSIAVDPSGAFVYVANAGSANVSAYTNASGVLTAVGGSPFAAVATPFSVNVDPSGAFVYVANFGTPYGVSVYSIGGGGVLTSVETESTGTGPTSVTTTQ